MQLVYFRVLIWESFLISWFCAVRYFAQSIILCQIINILGHLETLTRKVSVCACVCVCVCVCERVRERERERERREGEGRGSDGEEELFWANPPDLESFPPTSLESFKLIFGECYELVELKGATSFLFFFFNLFLLYSDIKVCFVGNLGSHTSDIDWRSSISKLRLTRYIHLNPFDATVLGRERLASCDVSRARRVTHC